MDEVFASRLPEAYVDTVAAVAMPYGWIVGAGTDFHRDLFPRVAARLGNAYAGDCVGVSGGWEGLLVERALFAGTLRGHFLLPGPRRFVTCRACAFPPAEAVGRDSPLARIEPAPPSFPLARIEILEDLPPGPDHARLSQARIVVAGGRGTKGKYGEIVPALADALGAATAATRSVCDAGFASRDAQVGQSGQTIAPRLYVALGVSGAIQHLAGVKDAGTIVAINRDRNAPIFQSADIGLVANLFDVVPELIERLGH